MPFTVGCAIRVVMNEMRSYCMLCCFVEKRDDLISPGNQGLRDVLRNANDVVARG